MSGVVISTSHVMDAVGSDKAYNGEEIDTTGDGFLIAFTGPARAVRCAMAIGQALKAIQLDVRAGLHTGEIHKVGTTVSGLSVQNV